MEQVIRLVGPNQAVEFLGIRLVGINAENGKKLLFSLVYVLLVLLIARLVERGTWWFLRLRGNERVLFWSRQGIRLAAAALLLLGLASIWFDDPTRLATALGLVTAGLAFALQRVVTALAGYFVILRGQTFNVGDRIRMGGVRGDVIALGFLQTTIMEIGQPPAVQSDEPAMWVKSRQYTGRIVTVSNATIFDEPVYNYTHHFPFLWEEMTQPRCCRTRPCSASSAPPSPVPRTPSPRLTATPTW
jgi:small-conductance mechanosensitive channel